MKIKQVFTRIACAILFGLSLHTSTQPNQEKPFNFNDKGLEKVTGQLFTRVTRKLPRHIQRKGFKRTPENKTIITQAIETTLPEVKVAQALINPTPEDIKALTDQLQRVAETAFTEMYAEPSELDWCTCLNAPGGMRIALVLRVVNDARKTRNPDNPLVYTSIASGNMLLDYLILSELKHYGFNTIQANFIDIGFMDIPNLKSALKRAKKHMKEEAAEQKDLEEMASASGSELSYEEQLAQWDKSELSYEEKLAEWEKQDAQWRRENARWHASNELDNALNLGFYTASFKNKIGATTQLGKGISVTFYDHAGDYLARAQKYPQEKTDILIMVDPDTGLFPLRNSIGANGFVVEEGATDFFDIYIDFSDNTQETASTFTDEKESSITSIDLGTSHQYIVFIPKTGAKDIQLYSNTEEVPEKEEEETAEKTSSSKLYDQVSGLIFEAQDVEKIRKERNEPFNLTSFMLRRAHQKFPQNEDRKATIYWLSEAYIVFQDIIRNGLNNPSNAAVYEIAYPTEQQKKPTLRKINPQTYVTQDVITPHKGAVLKELGYDRIDPSPEARKEVRDTPKVKAPRLKQSEPRHHMKHVVYPPEEYEEPQ